MNARVFNMLRARVYYASSSDEVPYLHVVTGVARVSVPDLRSSISTSDGRDLPSLAAAAVKSMEWVTSDYLDRLTFRLYIMLTRILRQDGRYQYLRNNL